MVVVDSFVFFLNFFSDELSADEILVNTIEGEQLLMVASFLDFSVLHDNDLVGIADGAQSMSNDHNSLLATADKQVQSLLHLMLTFGI